MQKDLIADLTELQNHLDGLMERVHTNGATLKRIQVFERELFNLNALAEMLEYVLNAREFFGLDYLGFCIIDEKGEYQNYLSEEAFDFQAYRQLIFLQDDTILQTRFGLSHIPYLGTYKSNKCAEFFSYEKYKPASIAIIPLVRRGKYLGTLCMGSLDAQRFVNSMATDFIEQLGSIVCICLESHLNFAIINARSFTDTMTGLNNRYFLKQRFGEEISRCQRSLEALSCLFLDIDQLRLVNANQGHFVGDQILLSVTAILREQLRNNDILVRYTKDKFVALLANIDQDQACEVAQRIRVAIKNAVLSSADTSVSVTVSIGSSTYLPSGHGQLKPVKVERNLIDKAEKALFQAKQEGRDRVVSSSTMSDPMFLANLFNRS